MLLCMGSELCCGMATTSLLLNMAGVECITSLCSMLGCVLCCKLQWC